MVKFLILFTLGNRVNQQILIPHFKEFLNLVNLKIPVKKLICNLLEKSKLNQSIFDYIDIIFNQIAISSNNKYAQKEILIILK